MFSWFNAQIKIMKQIPDASTVHYDTVSLCFHASMAALL